MYTIKEVGKLMHVSEHTIRFWAKNGFFPFIKRSDKNVRLFDDEDLEWVKLVKCLRSVGVNHNEIKNYIKMCLEGDGTVEERLLIIKKTKENVKAQLQELQEQLKLLDHKEKYYENLISHHLQDNWNPTNKVKINEKELENI